MSGRILREPAFQHAFFLFKHLQDAPETGKSRRTEHSGKYLMVYEY